MSGKPYNVTERNTLKRCIKTFSAIAKWEADKVVPDIENLKSTKT